MMQKNLVRGISIILFTSLVLGGLSIVASARPLNAISPTLAASESYSVLGASTVTNTGITTISGDVGVSPGTAITGFPPGVVVPPGTFHAGDGDAAAAQLDNAAVFAALSQTCDQTYGAVDLTTIFPDGVGPGVYCSSSSFALSGNLNLIGSEGVWIFIAASTLITSPGASVTGGDPCNVWWRVGSSATLGTTTAFIGNIFALASITMNTGATLNGRALAQTGAVTLDTNTINGPICAAQQPIFTLTTTPSTTLTSIPSATSTATSASIPTITTTSTLASLPTSTLDFIPTSTSASEPITTITSTESTGTSTTSQTISAPTNTLVVPGLPESGGATIQSDEFPWGFMIVGVFNALALVIGLRAYRKINRPKQ